MVISMYFAVSWEEPRMVINESAVEWRDARTGPTDVRATDFPPPPNIKYQIPNIKYQPM